MCRNRTVSFFLFFIALLYFYSGRAYGQQYQKESNGITLPIGEAKLGITVISDDIMQVRYTLADAISNKKSLILEDKSRPVPAFNVSEKQEYVLVKTSKMKAKINAKTGEVSFYDADNHLLLKEKVGGGKAIKPIVYSGVQTNEIQQEFESSPGEALYGLGQHQDRLLNIKGYDLDLFQHNTEVYVPFYVSTKGYGLLWHNYSHTQFNHPDSIQSISANHLFNEQGKQGRLTAKLYADSEQTKPLAIGNRDVASTLSLVNDTTVKSVTLSGSIRADKTGEYLFYSYEDGAMKLYVNDELVLEHWAPYANMRDMGRTHLEKGKKYDIKLEWSRFHEKNSFKIKWREPQSNTNSTTLWSQAGEEINYFVFAGNSMDEIISGYRDLTGRAPMLPKYAMGFWQSREHYKTQQELLDVVKEFRAREIPLDVIIQDWQYWRKGEWGSHLFDTTRYPDAAGMIDTLHQKWNTKFMISVWGKFYPGTENFNEFNRKNLLYQKPLADSVRDFLQNRYTYYDAFNPKARATYWNQLNTTLFSKGVDGWWLDASEPELPDFGPTPKLMAEYMNPTAEGPGVINLNAFPLMTTEAVYEGQRKTNPNKRVNILTRSGFAGQQRYATTIWSGDIAGEWSSLKSSIPAGLSLTLSGLPYWTTDIGGFWVKYKGGNQNEEYRELFTRWYQFGAFCPIFRVHGSSTEREMWFFGDKGDIAYQTQLKFNKLRYKLMPYIYSLAGMITHENYTSMRALVMDFQQDKTVWDIQDQFMFGPAFLVNPVTRYKAKTREVYLPKSGGWYDFWTGTYYKSGQTITVATPLESMPLFVKAGSIVPFGPALQYATEKPADPIELRIYTGDDGSFTLYEDENDNYNYEQGAFSAISFTWNKATQKLEISDRKGSFPSMLKERTFTIVFIDKMHGNSPADEKSKSIMYKGTKMTILK